MDNKLLELSDELKSLRDRKSALELDVKNTNEEIEVVSTKMIDIMTTEELTNFNRNGTSFLLVMQEYPSPEAEKKADLYDVMKEQGFEHLFTINSKTLQATVKELMSNNDGVLPEWLTGLIKVAEKASIRVRKG